MKLNKKEVVEFLKDLQKRLKEQENNCQAFPYFWGIEHTVKEYGLSVDNGDLYFRDLNNPENEYYLNEVEELFKEQLEEQNITLEEFLTEKELEQCNLPFKYGEHFPQSVIDFMSKYFDIMLSTDYKTDVEKVIPGTFFLTKSGCKEHIEKNYYHYGEKPHTYAMTVWRNPDLEKVMNILYHFDFDSLDG